MVAVDRQIGNAGRHLRIEPSPNATNNCMNNVKLSCSANVRLVWPPFSIKHSMLGNVQRCLKIV